MLTVAFLLIVFIHVMSNGTSAKQKSLTEDEYCKIAKFHVFCEKYADVTQNVSSKLYPHDIDEALLSFNDIRAGLANGLVPGMPKASNMQKLRWNEFCYNAATIHATHCNYKEWRTSNYCLHACSDCLNLDGFEVVILSLQMTKRAINMAGGIDLMFLNMTYNESSVEEYNFSPTSGEENSFQALANAQVTEVGCCMSLSLQGNYLLTCVLGGVSHLIGKPVYLKGEPCSQCPKLAKCDKIFFGLCVMPEGEEGILIKSAYYTDLLKERDNRPVEIVDLDNQDYGGADIDEGSLIVAEVVTKPTNKKKKSTPKADAKSDRDTTSAAFSFKRGSAETFPSAGAFLLFGKGLAFILIKQNFM